VNQVSVIVQHRSDLPAGVPAIWNQDQGPDGEEVTLYLRAGLPTACGDFFRAMCVRDSMPECDFDAYIVGSVFARSMDTQPA
jgi:hypothetical protein